MEQSAFKIRVAEEKHVYFGRGVWNGYFALPTVSAEYETETSRCRHFSNPEQSLREAYRVLKPEGEMVLLDLYRDGFVRNLICQILPVIFNERGVLFYTKQQMKQMFLEAEFSSITQKSVCFYKLITVGKKQSS